MKMLSRVAVLASVAGVLAGPFGFAQGWQVVRAAEVIEQVLVKVNGDIITKTELEQRQIEALRRNNPEALKSEAGISPQTKTETPKKAGARLAARSTLTGGIEKYTNAKKALLAALDKEAYDEIPARYGELDAALAALFKQTSSIDAGAWFMRVG